MIMLKTILSLDYCKPSNFTSVLFPYLVPLVPLPLPQKKDYPDRYSQMMIEQGNLKKADFSDRLKVVATEIERTDGRKVELITRRILRVKSERKGKWETLIKSQWFGLTQKLDSVRLQTRCLFNQEATVIPPPAPPPPVLSY